MSAQEFVREFVQASMQEQKYRERRDEEFPGCRIQRPSERGGWADAATIGNPGADQGEGGRRLPQRSAHLGRRLRSRPWTKTAVAEGPRRVAAANHGA